MDGGGESEGMSEESSEGMSTSGQGHVQGGSSVTGYMSTSTKRGASSLLDLDSVPNSPASSNFGGTSEETKEWRKLQKDLQEKLRTVRTHKLAGEFLPPVRLPGYDETVKRPMDLNTIKQSLNAGLYRSLSEFKRDVMLVFINATMYNAREIEVHSDALEVLREFLVDIEEYEETSHIISPDPPLSAPVVEGKTEEKRALDKKPLSEATGRTTPLPKTRTSLSRRRGDSSSVLVQSEHKDKVGVRIVY